jgi:hypothetical protein
MVQNFQKEYNEIHSRYSAQNLLLPVLFGDAFALMSSDHLEDRQYMLRQWQEIKHYIDNIA